MTRPRLVDTSANTSAVAIFEMPVHPAADVWPMLNDDELDELADDIKANGMLQPIVVKGGVLIDGRNRREACRRAGIVPATTELGGHDDDDEIRTYVASCEKRRHQTKGQHAMGLAMLFPEPAALKRKDIGSVEITEQNSSRLSHARTVLKWSPELASGVLNGAESLDKAYAVAQARRNEAEAPQRRLAALRAVDADLADKVTEGDLDLADAEAAARARRERERTQRQGFYNVLEMLQENEYLFTGANRDFLAQCCREHPAEVDATQVKAMLRSFIDNMAATIKVLP